MNIDQPQLTLLHGDVNGPFEPVGEIRLRSDLIFSDFFFGRFKMKNLALRLKKFIKNEDGPTAVEYAVMLSLIIVLCLAAVRTVGTNASQTFSAVAGQISGGGGGGGN